MKFRALREFDTECLKFVARVHEEVPRLWDPGFILDEEMVLKRTEQFRLRASSASSLLLVAEDSEIVGFHWIDLEEGLGHIKSLWVHERVRGTGLGRDLKQRGEAWALDKSAKGMKTYVHSSNQNMMQFNLRRGFSPTWVSLEKRF